MSRKIFFAIAALPLLIGAVGAPSVTQAQVVSVKTERAQVVVGQLIVADTVIPLHKADITDATASFQNNVPAVFLSLSPAMTARFCTLTTAHIGKSLKIVIGGKTVIDAIIQSRICGGKLMITGRFTVEQTKQMAAQLK